MLIRGEKDLMSERYWKNEWQYQRILEILDDYWITQKDEILVNVEMQFFSKDGQFQRKCITWRPKEGDFTAISFSEPSLDGFVTDCLTITTDQSKRVSRNEMYGAYEEYCISKGVPVHGRQRLFKHLRLKGIQETATNGYRFFKGVSLTDNSEPTEEKEIEEKEKMENIVWFNKDRSGWTQKKCDMSVSKVKDGINIILRNGLCEEVTSTGFIRIGFSEKDRNRMFFMAADKDHGWKFSLQPNSTTSYRTHIRDEKVIEGMLRFIGDYDLEISEDNLFFIDRRNVL